MLHFAVEPAVCATGLTEVSAPPPLFLSDQVAVDLGLGKVRESITSAMRGPTMKTTRFAAASFVALALAFTAAPAYAAQPQASDKQNAVATLIYKALKRTQASSPKAFKSTCLLYTINPKTVLDLFFDNDDFVELSKPLGASKKDFRAGINIALKKACA